MDLDFGASRNHRTSSFVQLLDFKRLLLDETFLNELLNFVSIGWNARKLVYKVTITDQVYHRHMLNLHLQKSVESEKDLLLVVQQF